MSSRFTELIIDARDPEALAAWWGQVLECDVKVEHGTAWLEPVDTVKEIVFVPVPETKTRKNRIHIDVRPLGTDQAAELARLKGLGAVEIDVGQGDHSWVVLADPEGNEFCLLERPFDDPETA